MFAFSSVRFVMLCSLKFSEIVITIEQLKCQIFFKIKILSNSTSAVALADLGFNFVKGQKSFIIQFWHTIIYLPIFTVELFKPNLGQWGSRASWASPLFPPLINSIITILDPNIADLSRNRPFGIESSLFGQNRDSPILRPGWNFKMRPKFLTRCKRSIDFAVIFFYTFLLILIFYSYLIFLKIFSPSIMSNFFIFGPGAWAPFATPSLQFCAWYFLIGK